jgi:hypothetical protein
MAAHVNRHHTAVLGQGADHAQNSFLAPMTGEPVNDNEGHRQISRHMQCRDLFAVLSRESALHGSSSRSRG